MFIGIRWFVEQSTPRHAHPVRSAEKTTAATLLLLILGAATVNTGHIPSLLPLTPPTPSASLLSLLQSHACPDCCLSTQTRTFCCQQKHTWQWCCHPTPCRQHTPTRYLLLSKLCSIIYSHLLLPTQLFPHCLESGLPSSTTHVFSMGFSQHTCVLMAEACIWQPGRHMLCPQTWAVDLISCYCVTMGNRQPLWASDASSIE